ncbi:MAG: nuclear transport factor 2 family protein, partial [Brevundimonas sp.]
ARPMSYRVEDRYEIRDLSARYALATDARDFEAVGRLFSDDVVYGRIAGNEVMGRGRDAAVAHMRVHFGVHPTATFHYVHDVVIDFDAADADRARGAVVSHAESGAQAGREVHAVRYHDLYERVGGRWLIAERWLEFPLR